MLKRALLAVFALLVAVLSADVAVGVFLIDDHDQYRGRVLPPFGRWTTETERKVLERQLASDDLDRVRVVNSFDPELGWSNFPGAGRKDGPTHVNSIGARGVREYPPAPPEGTVRLVCYGESYTWGSEVEDPDCWPAQLETIDPGLEAINMGVGGYGTDQALMRFRRDGQKLGGQAVSIGLLLENIGRNVNRYRSMFYPQTKNVVVKPRFALEGGELRPVPLPFPTRRDLIASAADGSLADLLHEHEYWAGDEPTLPWSNIARVFASGPAYARRDTRKLWIDPQGEPFRVTLAIIETFHREALAAGAEHAVVLIFPSKRDLKYLENAGGRPYWRALLSALETREIPVLDFGPILLPHNAEKPVHGVSHLTPRGNRIVAEHVQQWLRERFESSD